MKTLAIIKDCPGVLSDGRAGHAMRDHCWNCAPFWETIPTCPKDGSKLRTTGYCRTCRKFYAIRAEVAA